MAPESNPGALELFKAALDRSPAERAAFLDEACGDDKALRAEVESLLAADAQADGFLDSPLRAAATPETYAQPTDPLIGKQIGRYQIVRAIAAGGMGTVYEAMQQQPKRRVALKVVRAGLASRAALRRFAHEAEILARLRHPGIAQVFEAGTHGGAGGLPYFAMELIPGAKRITQYAEDERLSTRQRLNLFAEVCDATHHGHQRGIVHRDLKPGNILVDESGQPKVIDFGVARATDADMTIATLQTDVGELVGTLRYMSPEQCEGDSAEIDTRCDVYSLGVVLFELLTGQLPYDLSSTSPFEAPRVIREEEPRRLSAINRTLRGDVETIVLKALEKDRERRYQSALSLSQDIRRYLSNEPIEAKRDRAWYVLKKTLSRHRVAVGVIALVILLTTASAIGLGLMYRTADAQRALAEDRAEELRRNGYFNAITLARSALESEDAAAALRTLRECPADLRGWEWHYLHRLSDNSRMTLRGHTHRADPVFSPDGSRIASASYDRTIKLWDAATGEELRTLFGHQNYVIRVSFSPDGSMLASFANDRTIRLWDVETGGTLHVIGDNNQGWSQLAFSPDGRLIAYGAPHNSIKLWDVESRQVVKTLRGHRGSVRDVAFSPDGRQVASGSNDMTIKLWDVESGEEIMALTGHTFFVINLAFSPDGSQLASAAQGQDDNTIRIWNLETGELARGLDQGRNSVGGVAFSPDGRRFAAVVGLVVKVWDLDTWQEEAARTGVLSVGTVAFSPDAKWIAGSGPDGTIKVWDANPVEEPPTLRGHTAEVMDVVVTPDGQRILSASSDGMIRVWDVASRRELATLTGHEGRVRTIALSSDGLRLASVGKDRTLRLWDTVTGRGIHTISAFENGGGATVAFSRDDRFVATASLDGVINLWDARTAKSLKTLPGHAEGVLSITFSPDGRRLLSSGIDPAVRVWNVETGQELQELSGHTGFLHTPVCAVYSPDGALIATGDASPMVRIWGADTGELLHELEGHHAAIHSIAFSRDGRRLVSGGRGHLIKMWDVQTGKLVLTLRGHKAIVEALAFSPDGHWFVSASWDRTLKIWDAGRRD